MTTLLFFDTETTGADPTTAKIVEIGWVQTDDQFRVLQADRTLVDPEMPIPADAAGVHHITDEDVYNAPTISQIDPSFFDPFRKPDLILVAHNAPFDTVVARAHLPETYRVIDTLQLAKRFIKDAPNHKLGTLMYHCKLTRRTNTHSAIEDCMICVDLLRHIQQLTGKTLDELITAANEPVMVRVMPFGKHKGMKVEDVPKDYLKWALREMGNLDANARATFQKVLNGESLDEDATAEPAAV